MTIRQTDTVAANLIGACLSVLLAIPIGALIGSVAGDTYTIRVTVYIICLCYVNIGVFSVLYINRKASRTFELKYLLLLILSIWLWPPLVWTYALNRFRANQLELKRKQDAEQAKYLKDQMKNKKWR